MSRRHLSVLALLLALLSVSAGSGVSRAESGEATPAATEVDKGPPATVNGVDIDAIVKRLSLEEKVGQMLLLGFGGSVMDDTVSSFLKDKKPGGLAFFAPRNIKNLEQTLKLIRDVREYDPAGVPMFISVDQEGGNVVRLRKHVTLLPSNMAIGAAGDEDLSYRLGKSLGEDLAIMGFNMNLAPVLDVNSNPKNPVIGIRSFGEDPELVGKMGAAFVRGQQDAGVAAVAKHFPGHGDTETDSHFSLPVVNHDEARLKRVELVPFKQAFDAGLDAVMTAHISLPNVIEEKGQPATISKHVIGDILRRDIGYGGVVITDDLEMKGMIDRYGAGEAAVRAVEAGADMVMVLWFPENKNAVQKSLMGAVKDGRISQERLDLSVRRILAAKARRGMFTRKLESTEKALATLKSKRRRAVSEVARRAITLVKNKGGILPLKPDDTGEGLVIVTSERSFQKLLKKALPKAKVYAVRTKSNAKREKAHLAQIKRLAKGGNTVLFGLLDEQHADLVKEVEASLKDQRVVVVSFGSPYLLSRFPRIDAYVCAYGFRYPSERAAADVILGKLKPEGHLPVSVAKDKKVGFGLSYP